jgi:hypothetical protein
VPSPGHIVVGALFRTDKRNARFLYAAYTFRYVSNNWRTEIGGYLWMLYAVWGSTRSAGSYFRQVCGFGRRLQTITLPLPTISVYLGVSFEHMVYM